jgi:hypothetical protein
LFPKNARSGVSLALALLLLVPLFARAGEKAEIRPAILIEQDYDSNIFSVPNNDPILKGSPVTIIRPSLNFEDWGTLGGYSFNGWLSSHTYWNESALSGVDRGVSGSLDRTILPRFSLFGTGSYQRVAPHAEIHAPNEVSFVTPPGQNPEPIVSPGQLIEGSVPLIDLAQGEFGGRYLLTPRDKLSLSGGPYLIDYLKTELGRTDLRDRDGYFVRLSWDHNLTAIDKLTTELNVTNTNTDNADFAVVQVQDVLNPHSATINTGQDISNQQAFTIAWERNWSELWLTHFEIGVRRLESITKNANRQISRVGPCVSSTCTPDSLGLAAFTDFQSERFDSVGPGIVGGLTIRRVLPRGRAELSYQRETRTTSSLFSSDVNVDTAALAYVHNLSSRAKFTLTGTFEHYQTVNDAPVIRGAAYVPDSFNPISGPEFECASGGKLVVGGSGANKHGQCQFADSTALASDAYYGEARLDWQLRKRLATFLAFRYTQRTGDVLLFGPAYNKYNVGIGFTWDYTFGY